MKNRYSVALVLVVGLGTVWWLCLHKPPSPISQSTATDSPSVSQRRSTPIDSKAGAPSPVAPTPNPSHISGDAESPVSEEVTRYIQNVRADPTYDWKQAITFYGKVVDEHNQPIPDANVHFVWNDLSENGTSESDTKSDAFGLFSLEGQKGKRLCLSVSKEGYYTATDARVPCYEYANPGDGLFTPDANNPVVLHLRKKGVGVVLITSQYGVSPDFSIHVPRDGTPVKINLLERKVGGSGQIQLSENKPDHSSWREATSWSFRMEIPDGGFVAANNEFRFEAPESGYQSVIELRFQKGNTNWTEGINESYYIKFGNPPTYGRFQVQTDISMGGAIITYAINPDGSRNLEPK